MPPKGYDTPPPASPCRDLVLALSVASMDQQQQTSGGSTTASADAGAGIGNQSNSATPLNASSISATATSDDHNTSGGDSILADPIAAGRGRRDRIRQRPVSSASFAASSGNPIGARPRRRHRVSLSFADDNDELGEEEIYVGHSHHQHQLPRSASAGLEMEVGARRSNTCTGSIDDGDDGDDEEDDSDGDDDRKPPANAGASATADAASQSSMSKKRPTPPLPTPTPISGLPPHFVSPPPSAQCAQPRRSSIRRPSVVSPDTDSCADLPPSTEEKPKMRRNNLSFQSVEVREYSQVLGDHPCCQSGLPLSLGWDYDADATIHDVDEYETHRESQRVKSRKDMKLDCEERREILSTVKQRVVTETTADGAVVASEETTAYTSMDLRRAERRLYRGRRVSSRKMDSFFGSASGIDDDVADGVADSMNGGDHQPAQSVTNVAPMSGKQRRHSFFTSSQEESTGISPHHE